MLHAAKQVFTDLIATYGNPAVEPVTAIRSPEQLVTQLVRFATTCRAEREIMRRG